MDLKKIIQLKAEIGMKEFDLLAYRYGFLTTSRMLEDELRLCAFDSDKEDYPALHQKKIDLSIVETEEELDAMLADSMESLRNGIKAALYERINALEDMIHTLENNG